MLAERAVHLVGRDVQEAESLAPLARKAEPVGPRRLEHRERAEDVGPDEGVAAGDRTVDVTLGGEVDDVVGPEALERRGDGAPIADVDFGEAIVRRVADGGERVEVAGIGELVEIEHVDALADEMPAKRRADEPGAAGDHDLAHQSKSSVASPRRGQRRSLSESFAPSGGSGQAMPMLGSSQASPRSCAGE